MQFPWLHLRQPPARPPSLDARPSAGPRRSHTEFTAFALSRDVRRGDFPIEASLISARKDEAVQPKVTKQFLRNDDASAVSQGEQRSSFLE